MAIVTYVPPFLHLYGTLHDPSGAPLITATHHRETGDVTRRRGRGEHPGRGGWTDSHVTAQWPPGEWEAAFKDSVQQWSKLTEGGIALWETLLWRLQNPPAEDVPFYTCPRHLFISVNIFRWLDTGTTSPIPPDIDKLPRPYATITNVTSDGTIFSGSADTPNAPDDSLLYIRATNSRPTQARLFTRNDLRTPIYPFSNAFIPVAAGTAAWSFTPNVVSIKPGETIGIQTRLMSSEFLPLNAHFERLAIVAPTP